MDISAILKTVAPWIGTALGGPLGGMAVQAAASALGLSDKTVSAVQAAISGATPEQMLALKQADNDFSLRMQELGFKELTDLEGIAAGDRKSARDMQTVNKSKMPAVLTIMITCGFFGVLFWMLHDPTASTSPPLLIMLGSLGTAWTGSCAFWFGTTHQSGAKTDLLAQAEPLKMTL